ncbi:MAG: PAS domain S-box protein, partial [Bacteroidota bacterium]|nr:PAS domain S-box protein [Bacteroidota bacterium]
MNKVCLFIATSLLSFNLFANENVISGQQLKVFFLAFGLFSIIILVLLLIFIRKNKKQKAINSDYSMVLRNSQDKNNKLEEKLRRQESACQQIKELASVVENTNNAVIITGTDGKLEWVNEGFEILYGYDLDEFTAEVGNNILTISTNPRAISEGIEHKKSVTYPTYRVNRKGKRIWLQVEFTPITDSSGNIKKFVFVEADVSLYKVNETEILQQVEEVDNQLTISEMKREKMSSKYKIFTDSVNYALRIQNAILPSKDTLDKILGDYFILFRPRDIVSGDFYWVSEYYNKTIIAVADCTGHGVPGAFMSILGSAFLTEIVGQSKELKANEILNELRNIVISSFSK